MAQVIRKYLEGGKTKPTIVKIDGKDYNYDDIERNVWGNFEAHAKANNWDAETQNAVRDYLEYSLAGLKSGELSYGHNRMNNVSLEYESDGTFNTKGKGLFKRDITNDKRAGATLGTAYYNTLFNNNVMSEYKAPELKNIGSSLTLDIAKKIMDNNYGGNAEAMQEGWYKLTPLDRYTIFRQALADLNYSADEYKDVEGFNTKRASLLQLLENPYTDELNPEIEKAYAALGGYGLTNLLKGEAKTSDTDELKPVSIEDKRKEWRLAAIAAGINTEQGIADYIALLERKYNESQNAPGEELKELLKIDLYKSVEQSLDNYVKWRKGDWYKRYSNINKYNKIYLKEKANDAYNFSNFTKSSFLKFLNQAIKDVYSGRINPYMWRGLMKQLVSMGLTADETTDLHDGSQRYKAYIIPGSEDYENETVLAYVNDTIKVVSMHDFLERYQKQLLNNFTKLYNLQNNANLPDNWLSDYLTLSNKYASLLSTTQQTSGQTTEQTQSNKNGGVLKALSGASLMYAALNLRDSIDPTTQFWNNYDNILSQKHQAEIDEATNLGITVEELRKLKAEQKKKKAEIDRAVKHGLSTVEGFTDYDWANIAGAGFDIVETIGSLTGGAADPITWVGGIGSLGSYLYADANDPRVSKWDVAKNLGINLGISALGLVPGLGASAPIARTAKILTRFAPKLLLAFLATLTLPEAYNATKKLTEKGFSSLTNDELLAIARGIQTLSAGTRTAVQTKSEFRASKPSEGKRTIELLNEQKGRFSKELTPEQYNKIKGKTAAQAEEILGNDFLNGAHVAEGGKRYWLTGSRNPITTNEGTSWYSRNIGNRLLKSIEEVKPNARRDWLRALGLPMNTRSERFYNWRLNLHMPSWMPSFSRTRMSDEEFRRWSGLPEQRLATVEGQGARTVSLVNAAELRALNRARRAAALRTEFPEFTPYRTRSLITRTESPLQTSIMHGLNRGEYPLRLPTSRFTLGEPNYGTVFSTQPLFAGLSNPKVSIPSRPLLLEQRNISSGNTSKLIRTKAEREKQIKFVLSALKDKNAVLVVDRNGNVMFATKDSKLQRISPNTKVTVKKGKETLEMSIADAMTLGYQITFNLQGGFISRVISLYQQGGSIPKYAGGNLFSNVLFGEGNNWKVNVYDNIEADLLERLKNAKTLEEKKKIIDAYNNMLTKHSAIYSTNTTNGLLNNSTSFDLNTSDYQNAIIKDYDFVNTKGIKAQWKNGAYNTNYNRNVGKDGYGDGWDKSYAADGLYGGQTDDRRILGRKGDFDESSEDYKALVKRWQDVGADIYLDPATNYYMLKLTNSLPTLGNGISLTHVDPLTGEEVQYDPNTGQFKAVGNGNPLNKTKAQTIGEDVLNYIKNINPADAIALGRALWGENVNNKVTELTKLMQTALLDPLHLTAILHGNYNAKMLAQELAGKINAATLKPISSDAGTNYAARLEAALKATLALQQGNAEDSEMYWKTLQILNLVNNENAAQEVATGNENRSRVTAAYNNRLQAEAARLTANFELIWQPFLEGVEKRYRDEDTLRRLAEIDNWKYKVTGEYEKKNDLIMENYRARLSLEAKNWNENNPKYKEYNGDFWNYFAREISPEYLKLIKDVSREMYDVLYGGLSQYYGYTPFQLKKTPAIEVPGITGGIYKNYATKGLKSGGTLSAAERQALKTTNEINKNIRQAARETYKNIREDKREHRKAMALVSQLSADLIKKAVGIK